MTCQIVRDIQTVEHLPPFLRAMRPAEKCLHVGRGLSGFGRQFAWVS
ncbi:hypothetical protein GCM10010149_53620 [Nonomuraea roseoviolacea subsp. roseoviolacea]